MPDERKVGSDYLLTDGTILTMDGAATVLEGDLRIENGRIVEIGTALSRGASEQMVDCRDTYILPGFVQGHVHLGQTLFRGLAEKRPLLPWLEERIWPLESGHDDESAYWGTLLGAAECLLGGTTTVQDIGIGPGAAGLLRGIVDSGLRALAGQCLMDSGTGLPRALLGDPDRVLADSKALGDRFDGNYGGRIRYGVNPRFILSCSDELWAGLRMLSEKNGWPIHTHALEQEVETEAVRALKGGRDEIEYFDDCGVLSRRLSIAHGVWLSEEHLDRVSPDRFSVIHCPTSNLKLGSGIADVPHIRSRGVAVGLGADGTACNNGLDALREVRLAGLLQHHRHGPASCSGFDVLRLATAEGARAIGWEDEIGTLEVGKRADVVILSRDRPEAFAPKADPHDIIAFSLQASSVRTVMVDGEILVDGGELCRLDLPEIYRESQTSLDAILARAEGLKWVD